MKFTDYVNVFHGCGEVDPMPEGIAAKWFFIKAGCGNTNPAACLPFGAMSVGPFSGGYPTGYGDHLVNTYARPRHFEDGKKLLGFAHLQQSGTGTIGYYYNYAVVTPRYDNSSVRRSPENETGEPGYYSCRLEDIKCELTSDKKTAYHRYSFGSENGKVTIDFTNNGLSIPGSDRKSVENLSVSLHDGKIVAEFIAEGIKLYFAVEFNGKCDINGGKVCVYDFGNVADIKVSVSLRSLDIALDNINRSRDFDDAKENASEVWNEYLSKFVIETEDESIKRIFYSNLYHSLIKPCDWSGESFIYDGDGAFCTDLATLWDMYKTAMPMIFMAYPREGKVIADTLISVGDALDSIPNSIGISDKYAAHSTQARMLGTYVLITAYRYGVKVNPQDILRVALKDVFADNKKDFVVDGKCSSDTFLLDMADGCALLMELAKEQGNNEAYIKLKPLADKWETAYSAETGLLREDSEYYEGTLYNYSFRQMVNMDERIEIAGGKENFVKLLDKFFGYGQPDVVLPTDPSDYTPVAEGIKLGRFEGFNNESDTEAPYSYIYAGRHDRTCEIARAGMKCMFREGKGGIPGNNDSGALSSYYVFAALGIFPVAGQDLFLVGSPFIRSAEISLFNGNKLFIDVNGVKDGIYVEKVRFNGKEIKNYMLTASELMRGGKLEFVMTDVNVGKAD